MSNYIIQINHFRMYFGNKKIQWYFFFFSKRECFVHIIIYHMIISSGFSNQITFSRFNSYSLEKFNSVLRYLKKEKSRLTIPYDTDFITFSLYRMIFMGSTFDFFNNLYFSSCFKRK